MGSTNCGAVADRRRLEAFVDLCTAHTSRLPATDVARPGTPGRPVAAAYETEVLGEVAPAAACSRFS